jgi:acetylglutamate synthase
MSLLGSGEEEKGGERDAQRKRIIFMSKVQHLSPKLQHMPHTNAVRQIGSYKKMYETSTVQNTYGVVNEIPTDTFSNYILLY